MQIFAFCLLNLDKKYHFFEQKIYSHATKLLLLKQEEFCEPSQHTDQRQVAKGDYQKIKGEIRGNYQQEEEYFYTLLLFFLYQEFDQNNQEKLQKLPLSQGDFLSEI